MSAGFGFVTGGQRPAAVDLNFLQGPSPARPFEVYRQIDEYHPELVTYVWRITDQADVRTIWDTLAEHLRNWVQTHPDIHQPYLNMIANPDDSQARSRGWAIDRNQLHLLTAEILGGFFQGMLGSDQQLTLPGVRIEIWDRTAGLRDVLPEQVGAGRQRKGTAVLPARLKRAGITCHPLEYSNPDASARNCGPRAFLNSVMALDAEHIDNYYNAADILAAQLGITSGYLELPDFQRIVDLPEYAAWRIVVWIHPGHTAFQFKGPQWAWNLDIPLSTPDPLTASIYLDEREHYWTISHPKSFYSLVNKNHHRDRYGRCHLCCEDYSPAAPHHCSTESRVQQCEVCKRLFADPNAFIAHQDETREYPACDVCGKTTFYGPACHASHLRTNCTPRRARGRDDPPERFHCDTCQRDFSSHYPHNCLNLNLPCRCGVIFNTVADMDAHRCQLQPNTKRFWNPVAIVGTKSRTIWKSHYAFDFETTRHTERSPGQYIHKVLSWSVQLMVPDELTAAYLVDGDVLATLSTGFRDALPYITHPNVTPFMTPVPPDADTPYPSLRFSGGDLQSFLYVCEYVLARDEPDVLWEPTLWAHNGSKFDVKFIFDHYVNCRGFDMAGASYSRDYDMPLPTRKLDANGQPIWTRHVYSPVPQRLVQVSLVGNKMLSCSLKALHLTFKCTYAHHTAPLRQLPATFGLTSSVRKGEFPYSWLTDNNWDAIHENGLPPLADYDLAGKGQERRLEVAQWWVSEQQRRNVPPHSILEQCHAHGIVPVLDDRRVYDPDTPPEPWHYADEMWAYLADDVHVLARAMEAYHRSALALHDSVWARLAPDHPLRTRFVSPLDTTTVPGWALLLYRTWFMPPDTLYTLAPGQHNFITQSLRGGRTDKRASYVEVTPERRAAGDRILYLDFKSLYPSVMKCDIHDTHFPVGKGRSLDDIWPADHPDHLWWQRRIHGPQANHVVREFMANRTGFLQVDVLVRSYNTHPVLHHIPAASNIPSTHDVEAPRLLFANHVPLKTTYAWPELEEAMRGDQVLITRIHHAVLFDRGTNLFDGYIDFFFELKEKAEQDHNPGLRALAKLLLNSLWGKLGQRSYPIKEWTTNSARIDYLAMQERLGHYTEVECFRLSTKTSLRLHYEYRQKTDRAHIGSTAPHVAAFVSMWGRVILQQKVLRKHGQRVLYTDTDSAIIYVRAGDHVPHQGSAIGDLTDELPKIVKDKGYTAAQFPNPYIKEFAAIAPKTYSFLIANDANDLTITKAVCKGYTPSYRNQDKVCHTTFKELMWAEHKLAPLMRAKRPLSEVEDTFCPTKNHITTHGHLQFRSNLSRNQPIPMECTSDRVMTGRYTKGRPHPVQPLLVIPFGDVQPRGGHDDHFLTFHHPTRHYL